MDFRNNGLDADNSPAGSADAAGIKNPADFAAGADLGISAADAARGFTDETPSNPPRNGIAALMFGLGENEGGTNQLVDYGAGGGFCGRPNGTER